eukprot:Gb_13832 [translate_table: standard]
MPEEKGGGSSSRAVFSAGGGFLPFEIVEMPGRQRFSVELRPDETTVISWKKLVKDSQKTIQTTVVQPPAGAHPALEARIAPEAHIGDSDLQKDALPPPPNRFSAVIEKIERLYKGGQSSDEEELDDVPDDDQYDTEDSFIDDEELDEYFSVDKSKTKHSGFFINRGKLERETELASSPVHAPKKRKRKDVKKIPGDKSVEEVPKKLLKVGGVRMKAAARSAPLVALNVANSGQVQTSLGGGEHLLDKTGENQEVKGTQTQPSTFGSGPSKAEKYKEEEISISVKSSHKDLSRTPADIKDGGKPKSAILGYKDSIVKGAVMAESSDSRDVSRSDKNALFAVESQTKKYLKDAGEMTAPSKIRTTEKAGKGGDSRDVNVSGNKLLTSRVGNPAPVVKSAKQRKKSSSPALKEDSPGRPKGSMLERAIQELERSVAQLCPPTMDIQEADQSSQGVKRRLPRAVRVNLAKVARLGTNQGKISDDLIDRLMNIVGHIIQLKTLKRNLKEMIEMGKSAKQEKEWKLQGIKREVTEMIKMRVSSLKSKVVEQREGSSDDFQVAPGSAEKGGSSGRYKWDNATEDRLCDLYDQYIEGMDEHKGPQIRKLYLELAELWPEGWMDNHGIKHAVYRAKERKKRLNKVGKGMEKSKRKKVSVRPKIEEWDGDTIAASESNVNNQAFTSYDKQIELERAHNVSVNGGNILQCKLAKAKSSSVIDEKRKYVKKSMRKDLNNVRQWNNVEVTPIFKKKLKRKPDIDAANTSTQPMKISSFHGKEMHKVGKQVPHGSSLRNKGSPQIAGLPACESVKIG